MTANRIFAIVNGTIRQVPSENRNLSLAAAWLYQDIQPSAAEMVDLVDHITSLAEGFGSDPFERSGNAWHAVITAEGVWLENLYNLDEGPWILSHIEVLNVIRHYWNCVLELGRLEVLEDLQKCFSGDPRPPAPRPLGLLQTFDRKQVRPLGVANFIRSRTS